MTNYNPKGTMQPNLCLKHRELLTNQLKIDLLDSVGSLDYLW